MTLRMALASLIALMGAGCYGLPSPRSSELEWGASLKRIEQQIRESDDFDMRCVVAAQYLTLVTFPGLEDRERRAYAERALLHADAALRLDDERVEGHYHRAVAIGYVLQYSAGIPRPGLIAELEGAGRRARALDPDHGGAGPLRLLAMFYWKAPRWPLGPEDAQDDEVIEPLFREAISRAPGCTDNHIAYAEYLLSRHRRSQAIQHAMLAKELLREDPLATPFDRPELMRRIDEVLKR